MLKSEHSKKLSLFKQKFFNNLKINGEKSFQNLRQFFKFCACCQFTENLKEVIKKKIEKKSRFSKIMARFAKPVDLKKST